MGKFRLHTFKSVLDDRIHYGLSYGKWSKSKTPMVRVQTANIVSDVLGYYPCGESRNSVEESLRAIVSHGCGALLYLEPRKNDDRTNEINSKSTEAKQRSEASIMDFRDYGIGAQILSQLGLQKIHLLINRPRHVVAIDGYGLEIVEQISLLD